MSRPSLLVAVALLVLAASLPAMAQKKEADASTRPYVETSYLIAPKQVGDFELEGASFNPEQKYAGAGFRYALKGHQETRFDLYVYPAGKMEQAQAVKQGMAAFRADLKLAADGGTYTQLRELQQAPFPLPPMQADAVPANDFDASVIKAMAEAAQLTGEKLQLSMNLPPRDWPMHSNGYLFYRQLYYFKLRASAAQERITADEFNALTDLAARTLIPALQVANVGSCAGGTIYLNPDMSPEQSAQALVRQTTLLKGNNCHLSAKEAGIDDLRANADIVEISFNAEEWKSQ